MKVPLAAWLTGAVVATAVLAASCVTQAEQGLEVAGQAQDVQVQADLRQASSVAHIHFAENGTLDTFNASAATQTEPSAQWSDGGPASEGRISIRGASETTVALVSRSSSGTVYCIGVQDPADSLGKVDAQSAGDCTGGW